jgi:kynurenine formamidase
MTATESRVGNWGRWGDEDERGTLNLITPDVVRSATQAVTRGKTYSLALPIQRQGVPILDYRGAPMRLALTHQSDVGMFEAYGAPDHVGANEDVIVLASHNETHMDALCHVFSERRLYNGFPAESVTAAAGATKLGIDKVRSIVGRAVLLDMPGFFGVERIEAPRILTGDELLACARHEGVDIRPGDILLVRTGWIDAFLQAAGSGGDDALLMQPGIGLDACRTIAELDVAAVGCDNSAVEAIPFDENRFLCVHIELLVKLGLPLIEHLMLAEMAADQCYESLFVAAPLPVVGGTGSPVNPIAIG